MLADALCVHVTFRLCVTLILFASPRKRRKAAEPFRPSAYYILRRTPSWFFVVTVGFSFSVHAQLTWTVRRGIGRRKWNFWDCRSATLFILKGQLDGQGRMNGPNRMVAAS